MAALRLAVFLTLALSVFAASTSGHYRQQEEPSEEGYMSSIMSTVGGVSEMDWRGMVRTLVDAVMNYLSAPNNRVDSSSSRGIGGDMAVHFVESSPTLRYYAESVHDYIRSFNHFFN